MSGNLRLVKTLLLFGANYDKTNNAGKTPGLLAIENRNKNGDEILVLMKEVGTMVLGSNSPMIRSEPFFTKTPPKMKFSELKLKDSDENENRDFEDELDGPIKRSKSARDSFQINTGSDQIEKPVRAKSMDDIEELKSEHKRRKKLRVLCLDGGGIRGLVLTQLLIGRIFPDRFFEKVTSFNLFL